MSFNKILKGSLALIVFNLILFFPIVATPLSPDIRERAEIGPKGGNIFAEDPEAGISVSLDLPAGALQEMTEITLVIHGSPLPKVLGKTHINGISVLPEDLFLQEKALLIVYNPTSYMTKRMILYRVVNTQFIIPLGSQIQHEDENWIEGTFYITGKFSLGTPTNPEITIQSKKLAEYNPARPLAYAVEGFDTRVALTAGSTGMYDFPAYGGPGAKPPDEYMPAPSCSSFDDEECLRWQKAMTKVEASLIWVEQHIITGNKSAENEERLNAQRALQEAIDGYLSKPSPANRCGSYIKAAAKYLEASMLLGINTENVSRLNRHLEQLIDECSFVFTVETREWIDHPSEKHDDGSITEEKMTWYGLIKCHIPWNEFLGTGNMKVRGEGNMSLHHGNHWIGGDENTHEETNTNWEATEIEGAVNMNYDEYGVAHPVANITIHWKGEAQSRMWGKRHGNPPYDMKGTDDRSYKEHKTYPIKNGYSEQIGNDRAGSSLKVYILKQPGDQRYNPNDCF